MTEPALTTSQTIPAVLNDLPLTLSVRVGTARRTVYELLRLGEGAEVILDASVDDPVDICIEDKVIARGELAAAEDGQGLVVRIVELCGEVPK